MGGCITYMIRYICSCEVTNKQLQIIAQNKFWGSNGIQTHGLHNPLYSEMFPAKNILPTSFIQSLIILVNASVQQIWRQNFNHNWIPTTCI